MNIRYCPGCRSLLTSRTGSRFVECPEHGRLIVSVSVVGEA